MDLSNENKMLAIAGAVIGALWAFKHGKSTAFQYVACAALFAAGGVAINTAIQLSMNEKQATINA